MHAAFFKRQWVEKEVEVTTTQNTHTHTHTHTRGGGGQSNGGWCLWATQLVLPLPVSPARVWLTVPVGQSLMVQSGVCGKTVGPPPLVRYKSRFSSSQFSLPRSRGKQMCEKTDECECYRKKGRQEHAGFLTRNEV